MSFIFGISNYQILWICILYPFHALGLRVNIQSPTQSQSNKATVLSRELVSGKA